MWEARGRANYVISLKTLKTNVLNNETSRPAWSLHRLANLLYSHYCFISIILSTRDFTHFPEKKNLRTYVFKLPKYIVWRAANSAKSTTFKLCSTMKYGKANFFEMYRRNSGKRGKQTHQNYYILLGKLFVNYARHSLTRYGFETRTAFAPSSSLNSLVVNKNITVSTVEYLLA